MDKERGFNFKLLVPPRVSALVSAVRPCGIVERSSDCGYGATTQPESSKYFDKDGNMQFPNPTIGEPIKPTNQDCLQMKLHPMEKVANSSDQLQLYSKLFEEVEKIKFWKFKMDSDAVQLERRLQEKEIAIQTGRKTIQELHYTNEKICIKLEKQIKDNEDLRNKNNATRNLCNILKDTFQRSADKMHLFESEREETHHFLMENSDRIRKSVNAFESLRIKAEADQQEMQTVKNSLLQLEDLKEKYHQEYKQREEEVAVLQTKLKDKDNELQEVLSELHGFQEHCRHLLEAINQQYELLETAEIEKDFLIQRCKECEANQESITAALEKCNTEYAQIIQSKDSSLQSLHLINSQQAEKLEQIQTSTQELQISLALETQRTKEYEEKLMKTDKELEKTNTLLGATIEQKAKKDEEIRILGAELDKKSKSIEFLKGKLDVLEARVEDLNCDFSRKNKEAQLLMSEAVTERDRLKEAYEAAVMAERDVKEEYRMTKAKVLQLEEQLSSEMGKNEEYILEIDRLRRALSQNETNYEALLLDFNRVAAEKKATEQHFESASSNTKNIEANMKRAEENAEEHKREIHRLEEENQRLREKIHFFQSEIQGKSQENETLQKEIEAACGQLQKEIIEKEKNVQAVETKLCNLKRKFETKVRIQDEYKRKITSLRAESEKLKNMNEEKYQKLTAVLQSKSSMIEKLENEVQKLRITANEAIKSKEDSELKCQHKTADMVALMEKHKNQYDRMIEEKNTALDNKKKKEMEAEVLRKSLELDISNQNAENDQLKKQIMTERKEKENLQKELTGLREEMSSTKLIKLSGESENKTTASNHKQGECSKTRNKSSKRHLFDFSKSSIIPSNSKDDGQTAKEAKMVNADLTTQASVARRVGRVAKVKSFRLKSPPSAEKPKSWITTTIELEPKSDSSSQHGILAFTDEAVHSFSSMVKKIQSPVSLKSPGNCMKLAAMKRMRDAGWTAVISCDKKKKINEKVFA